MKEPTTALIVAFALLCTAASVGGAPEYGLSVSGSVDAPDRTLPVAGHQFTATEVASVEPGDALSVDVAAPQDGGYELLLYDSDQRIVRRVDATAGERHTVDTEDLEPGAYLLVLRDEEVRAVHPVVVDGYAVDVNAPDAVEAGKSTTVVVSVSRERSTRDPAAVTVVASNGEESSSAAAERRSDGRYVASLDFADASPGEYTVLAIVRGEDVVYGRPEPLGVSDEHALTVTMDPVDDEWTTQAHEGSNAGRTATDDTETSSQSTSSDVITPGTDSASPSVGSGMPTPLWVGGVVVLLGYVYFRR